MRKTRPRGTMPQWRDGARDKTTRSTNATQSVTDKLPTRIRTGDCLRATVLPLPEQEHRKDTDQSEKREKKCPLGAFLLHFERGDELFVLLCEA